MDLLNPIPVVGHIKCLVHALVGDGKGAREALHSATRTSYAIVGAGVGTVVGGPWVGVAAAIGASNAWDGAFTAIDYAIEGEYVPRGNFAAISNIASGEQVGASIGEIVLNTAGDVTAGGATAAAGAVTAAAGAGTCVLAATSYALTKEAAKGGSRAVVRKVVAKAAQVAIAKEVAKGGSRAVVRKVVVKAAQVAIAKVAIDAVVDNVLIKKKIKCEAEKKNGGDQCHRDAPDRIFCELHQILHDVQKIRSISLCLNLHAIDDIILLNSDKIVSRINHLSCCVRLEELIGFIYIYNLPDGSIKIGRTGKDDPVLRWKEQTQYPKKEKPKSWNTRMYILAETLILNILDFARIGQLEEFDGKVVDRQTVEKVIFEVIKAINLFFAASEGESEDPSDPHSTHYPDQDL